MNGVDAGEAKSNSPRLRYKIIAYIAIWILALALTEPGLWPLPRNDALALS